MRCENGNQELSCCCRVGTISPMGLLLSQSPTRRQHQTSNRYFYLKVDASLYDKLIEDESVSHGAVRLWFYLRNRANQSGVCWPSQETICDKIHCKKHSLKEWTQTLVDKGYLKTERRGQNHHLIYSVSRSALNGTPAKCPSGIVVVPNGAPSRYAQKGTGIDPSTIHPNELRVSPVDKIILHDELKELRRERKEIRAQYDSHSDWDQEDRARTKTLNQREKEIKSTLGYTT